MMASRDAIHPIKKRRRRSDSSESKQGKGSCCEDFGTYQVCLLAATQMSYMPVAASMLSTSFMKMTAEGCAHVLAARNGTEPGPSGTNGTSNGTSPAGPSWPEGEFESVLSAWGLDCTEGVELKQTVINEMVMIGGLVGAMLAGFIADRYGRKPVMIASLALCSLSNALLLMCSFLSWISALPLFFVLGAACGGYMTTNLVLMVESLCRPSSRLLVVALNGWSLSMAGTGLLAYLCPNWFQYHLALAVLASISAVALYFIADESLRWLKSSHKVVRFDRASARLAKFNGGEEKDIALLCQMERDEAAAPPPLLMERGDEEGGELAPAPSVSYLDLFAERSLRPRLLALSFVFFSSSIVSFGFYFAFDSLGTGRYATLAVAGCGKFVLGLLPFVVSSCVSRKQVALISVIAAGLAAWAAFACLIAGIPLQSLAVSVLSLAACSALDPNWKISHLYSTELFPTNMRNMARGFCNSLARVGSVLAPALVHLRHDQPAVTIGMFAALLTAQMLVTARWLPDQPPSGIQNALPSPTLTIASISERGNRARRETEDEERSRENSSQLSETAPLTP